MIAETILVLGTSAVTAAIVAWALQAWISVRLKAGIEHEYAQKLEAHKTELNARIKKFEHENQLVQLRTSLFLIISETPLPAC